MASTGLEISKAGGYPGTEGKAEELPKLKIPERSAP